MTEEDKTLKWVNDTSNMRHKVKTVRTSGTTQEKAQEETSQTSGRHPGADTIHSAPPSYDGHQPEHATQKVQSSTVPNITQTDAIKKRIRENNLKAGEYPVKYGVIILRRLTCGITTILMKKVCTMA